MVGETNLDKLSGSMSVKPVEGLSVLSTVSDTTVPAGARPRMLFHEVEVITLILLKEAEANDVAYGFSCRMITSNIH